MITFKVHVFYLQICSVSHKASSESCVFVTQKLRVYLRFCVNTRHNFFSHVATKMGLMGFCSIYLIINAAELIFHKNDFDQHRTSNLYQYNKAQTSSPVNSLLKLPEL